MGVARKFPRGDKQPAGDLGACEPPSGVQERSPWKLKKFIYTVLPWIVAGAIINFYGSSGERLFKGGDYSRGAYYSRKDSSHLVLRF